jgi:4-amino-4-deoxy-L-arabinose transferase-like glycosyltransferase
MKLVKAFFAYLLAVVATTVLGSVAATQFVLADLHTMQVAVPFSVRIETTVHDIVGMGPTFAPIVAGALLVAFLVAALLTRFVPLSDRRWYLVGGFVGLIAALLLIKAVLGGTPIAGARGTLGLVSQGMAGLVGGWVFAKLCPEKEQQP